MLPITWHFLSHHKNITSPYSWGNLQIQTCKPSCTPLKPPCNRVKQLPGLRKSQAQAVAVVSRSVSLCDMTPDTPHFQQAGEKPRPRTAPASHNTLEHFLVAASVSSWAPVPSRAGEITVGPWRAATTPAVTHKPCWEHIPSLQGCEQQIPAVGPALCLPFGECQLNESLLQSSMG